MYSNAVFKTKIDNNLNLNYGIAMNDTEDTAGLDAFIVRAIHGRQPTGEFRRLPKEELQHRMNGLRSMARTLMTAANSQSPDDFSQALDLFTQINHLDEGGPSQLACDLRHLACNMVDQLTGDLIGPRNVANFQQSM